jgi:hypothetical protein
MTGFLARLVQRTIAPTTEITPRVHSRFESSRASDELADEDAPAQRMRDFDAARAAQRQNADLAIERESPLSDSRVSEPHADATPAAPHGSGWHVKQSTDVSRPRTAAQREIPTIDAADPRGPSRWAQSSTQILAQESHVAFARSAATAATALQGSASPGYGAGALQNAASTGRRETSDEMSVPLPRPSHFEARGSPAPSLSSGVTHLFEDDEIRRPSAQHRVRDRDSAAVPPQSHSPDEARRVSSLRSPPALTPRASASEWAPRFSGSEAAAPPAIHVTIGRVEIRATTPATPPRPRTDPRPAVTLADYLRQREGRGR